MNSLLVKDKSSDAGKWLYHYSTLEKRPKSTVHHTLHTVQEEAVLFQATLFSNLKSWLSLPTHKRDLTLRLLIQLNSNFSLISNLKRKLPRSKNHKRAASSPKSLTISSMNQQRLIWSISLMLPVSLIPRKSKMFLLLILQALSAHSIDNQQGSRHLKKLPKGLALMLSSRNKRIGSYLRSVIAIWYTQSSHKRQRRRKKHHLL